MGEKWKNSREVIVVHFGGKYVNKQVAPSKFNLSESLLYYTRATISKTCVTSECLEFNCVSLRLLARESKMMSQKKIEEAAEYIRCAEKR